MNNQTTIMFDVDGVLANFNSGYSQLVQRLTGVALPYHPDLVSVWDYDVAIGVTQKQIDLVWNEISNSSTFWLELPLLVTAHEAELIGEINANYPTYFVTARLGDTAMRQTQEWLLYKLGLDYVSVVVSNQKGSIAQAIRATHSIDDKAGNAVAVSYLSDCQSYVLNRPYNQFDSSVIGSRVKRVSTVKEFCEDILNE